MSAPPTFGLSAAALASRTFGLSLVEGAHPSLTAANEVFEERCGEVAAFFRPRVGDPSTLTADGPLSEGYMLARRLVDHLFTAWLAAASMPNEDGLKLAQFHQDAAEALKHQLRGYIAELGNARLVGHEAPGTMGSAYERKVRTHSLAARGEDRLSRMLRANLPRRS